MALQPITGYPSSWKAPFTAAEILFNQGVSTVGAGPRSAIYVMPKLPSGDWEANKVVSVGSEDEAMRGAGAGAPLHRALRMHLRANRRGKIYALPYEPTSGTGALAAEGTISFSGAATATVRVRVDVGADSFTLGFRSGATAEAVTAAVTNAISAKAHYACSASASAGDVTLTAKILGASQGDGTLGVVRFRVAVEPGKGLSATTTGAALGLGTGSPGTDGTTTENSNLVAALDVIGGARYYYVVFSDVASTADVAEHVSTKSQPSPGHRSIAITAHPGALSAAAALAVAQNSERMNIIWQRSSNHDIVELAANYAAIRQKHEATDSRFNFDDYSGADWFIKPAQDQADWPDDDDTNDAVIDGVTPVLSTEHGSRIAMTVSTRSKDATGAIDDFRSAETHRVSVMDEFADTWLTRHALNVGGQALADDRRLADGTVDHNQRVPKGALVPSRYKLGLTVAREFVEAGKVTDMDAMRASYHVNVDPQNRSRLEVGMSCRVIDLHHQTTLRLAEVSPG